ncbi:MAG: 1-acyl-sn-glycerol-3-phosphate acyltransferase [Planctomycetota bacterium]|jgi:1-acyl-sn-glycerol-3-phosphate acyltransferase|nr:1-acyl-sn-glycerol-3-phosphate acyltransferase [Planctomycetota bacterium]
MWKSFSLAAGIVSTAALPFYGGCEGVDNVPAGGCVVAANHSSFLDGPLLALAYAREKLRPLHMIAYAEPFSNWLTGWFLRSSGCVPFVRGDAGSQYAMLETALGWLAAGEAVGIFPEGHINPRPGLNRPRRGAALLALESGKPAVPCAVVGSGNALPLGARVPRPFRRARIRFGPPVRFFDKELAYRDSPADERKRMIENLSVRIMTAIALLAGRGFDPRRFFRRPGRRRATLS